jgi:hypothetical protein
MKLYTITITSLPLFDAYYGAVVAAHNKEEARNMHPNGDVWIGHGYYTDGVVDEYYNSVDTWVEPEHVVVEYIGEASKTIKKPCVIISSYNAG